VVPHQMYGLTESTFVLYEWYSGRMSLWADVRGTIHRIHYVIHNRMKQPLDRCGIVHGCTPKSTGRTLLFGIPSG
jgi:hypothetical protein